MRKHLYSVTACFAVFAASVLVVSPALAQSTAFERLETAAEELDFVAVLDAAETALASGTLGPRELVRLQQLVAMADTFGGNEAGARAAYERMLAIDADAIPDRSVPPRLRGPYDAARAARDRIRIGARSTVSPGTITVRVDDALGVVTKVVVGFSIHADEPMVELDQRSRPELTIRLPITEPADVRYYVELRDRFGNRWFELGSRAEPIEAAMVPAPPAETHRRRRVVRSPWLWVGVGALAVGLGVGIGVAHDRQVRAVTSVSF